MAERASAASVLVVEDEPLIRIFLAEVLRDAGLHVTEACTADEAAAILSEQEYCALLTDVKMPGRMDGVELAKHVCREHPGTAVIVASGHHVGKGLPDNVPLLRKPYDTRALVKLVKSLAAERRTQPLATTV